MENLGAGLLNCDTLAHRVYMRGKPCYDAIVQHFGKEILGDDGEINRKALGAIVFNNKVLELVYYRQTFVIICKCFKICVSLVVDHIL